MVCGYARVSTKIQEKNGNSLDSQEDLLRDSGARLVYKESCSGGTLDRPQLNELLHALEPGDTLMVTKLDRLARSASQGIAFINKLLGHGIKVHVLNMGLMDNTPTGKLIRTILLAFAEFERDMIVTRTQEGKLYAKQHDPLFREGRPKTYSEEQIRFAYELRKQGMTYKMIERKTGISKRTQQRRFKLIEKPSDTSKI